MKTKPKITVAEAVHKKLVDRSGKTPPFVPNATKSTANIKAKLSAHSKGRTQVGF